MHPAQHRECLTTVRPTKPEDILNEIELQPISKSQAEDTFTQELNTWRTSFSSDRSVQAFDDLINQFLIFLAGPKHPATRYYEARRKKRELNNQQTYKFSSNPQRATKRDRLNLKNIYQYLLAQFQFYNQRRKEIRQVFQNDTTSCSIDKDSLHDYFSNIFSTP